MSRHYVNRENLHLVIGADRPLKNVFMDIEKDGEEDFVFSSMDRDDYFTLKDIRVYAKIAKEDFGIDIPEEMLLVVEQEMKEIEENK